jgi:hypothetical protein
LFGLCTGYATVTRWMQSTMKLLVNSFTVVFLPRFQIAGHFLQFSSLHFLNSKWWLGVNGSSDYLILTQYAMCSSAELSRQLCWPLCWPCTCWAFQLLYAACRGARGH